MKKKKSSGVFEQLAQRKSPATSTTHFAREKKGMQSAFREKETSTTL